MRYYDLQHTLEEIFHNLSTEEQKRGAFLLFSYLSKWMWNTHFDARQPIDMKALVKTLDDAFTSMCEEVPREDLHPPS